MENKKKHKELKKKVEIVEKQRNEIRDWSTKAELINLKKLKLQAKDKLRDGK